MLLQVPTTGTGLKPALPEDLFMEPAPPAPAPPAPVPTYQAGLSADHLPQQQQSLSHQPAQQLHGVAASPGMAPQGVYLSQQQPQQQYFQAQKPQPTQQLFQPQQQPAFGLPKAAVSNGFGSQGYQAGQSSQGSTSAQSAQGRTLSGQPLPHSNTPDPFAGLGF